jgi:hypothetical protein
MKILYFPKNNAFLFVDLKSEISILVEDFTFKFENIVAKVSFTFPNHLTLLEGKKFFVYSWYLANKNVPLNWLLEIKEDYGSLEAKKEFIKIELKNLVKKYFEPYKTFSFLISFSPKNKFYNISSLISKLSNFYFSKDIINEILNYISNIIFKNEAKIKLGRLKCSQ